MFITLGTQFDVTFGSDNFGVYVAKDDNNDYKITVYGPSPKKARALAERICDLLNKFGV